ncbi:hypothetical protein D3C78_1698850 [compost metagenome]
MTLACDNAKRGVEQRFTHQILQRQFRADGTHGKIQAAFAQCWQQRRKLRLADQEIGLRKRLFEGFDQLR